MWNSTERRRYGYVSREDNKIIRRLAKQHHGEVKGIPVRGVLYRQDLTITFYEGSVMNPLPMPRERLHEFDLGVMNEAPQAYIHKG